MADLERTFAIIKPDAVAKQATGAILQCIEASGLEIIAMKRLHMTEQLAEGFYAVHKQRPFFGDLVKFMTSGPVVVLVLQAENAIRRWRDLMGPTNSNDAPPGTTGRMRPRPRRSRSRISSTQPRYRRPARRSAEREDREDLRPPDLVTTLCWPRGGPAVAPMGIYA